MNYSMIPVDGAHKLLHSLGPQIGNGSLNPLHIQRCVTLFLGRKVWLVNIKLNNNYTMKTRLPILLASIALMPALCSAGDLTGGNSITGAYSSANGYGNSITGDYCFSSGVQNVVRGNANVLFGYQNQTLAGNVGYNMCNGPYNIIGGYGNTVFGIANTTINGANGNFISGFGNAGNGLSCWLGGQNNIATGVQSLIFGGFTSDGGRTGCVLLSDGNPFAIRTATNRFAPPDDNVFAGAFNSGFRFYTNSGQGLNPDAGLHIIPSAANTATTSSPAYVGINTVTPGVPLDVQGRGTGSWAGYTGFFFGSTLNTDTAPGTSPDVSIRSVGHVQSSGFIATSDERIKNIQGRSDGAADLGKLLTIEVTDYLYKDVAEKGSRPNKKVIAQQVEKVFPQAVSQSKDVVPDIFKKAPIKDGWVALATDLKAGDRVRLITEKGHRAVHEVIEVTEGKFRTDFAEDVGQVFVYGREVKDFRSVDYDAISMLNVSATQELARKVDAKDAEIAALKKQLAALESRDQTREARLARLEAAGKDHAPLAVPASFAPNASAR